MGGGRKYVYSRYKKHPLSLHQNNTIFSFYFKQKIMKTIISTRNQYTVHFYSNYDLFLAFNKQNLKKNYFFDYQFIRLHANTYF